MFNHNVSEMYIKTQRLPVHFIMLGVVLLLTGIWRCTVSDWRGLIWLSISVIILLTSEGIVINSKSKTIKKYISILFIKIVLKEEIGPVDKIRLCKSNSKQNISMASITRSYNTFNYKVVALCGDNEVEIMEGKEKIARKTAEFVSLQLDIKMTEYE